MAVFFFVFFFLFFVLVMKILCMFKVVVYSMLGRETSAVKDVLVVTIKLNHFQHPYFD